MAYHKKATDEELIEAYERLDNVWKVADEFDMCGQSVHERLSKLGVVKPVNVFTEEDKKRLEEEYVVYRNAGKLQELADSMGRTKQFICRQAGLLGLTDKNHKRKYFSVWKYISKEVAEPIWEDFKRSRLGLRKYCESKGYDDLGFSAAMNRIFPGEYENVIESKYPRRSKYAIGRDFEYATKYALQRKGYLVMRSPGSRSPVDLIAIKSGELLFVQCKLHGQFPVSEWNEFIDYCASVGATPVMAERGKNNRGILYWQMTGKKDGSKRPQPMVKFEPTEKETLDA